MAEVRRRLRVALLAAAIGPGAPGAFAAEAPASPPSAGVAASAPASAPATARFEAPKARLTAADPALEARMLAITGELRCLVCQNQTIADSHADLAVDLRQEVRELLQKGKTPEEIRQFMTDRYGDFVLYRPPLKASTAVLWLGPAVLLAIALLALVRVIRKRARLSDDHFEPEPTLDDGTEAVDASPRPGSLA
jgi:cytochrome c-type biogenesis protein CcmH